MRANKKKEVILIEMNQLELLVKYVGEFGEVDATVVLDRRENKYVIKFFCEEWENTLGLHTQRKKGQPKYFTLDHATSVIKKMGISQFTVILSE